MAKTVDEVMTHDPRTVSSDAPVAEAAREMRDGDVGAVIVSDQGSVRGIVTDRDIAVRAVAEGRDPNSTPTGEIATTGAVTVTPDQPVEEAIRIMREHGVRRVPVVQDGRPAGIVTIGDLAIERDSDSALAEISAQAPNN